MDRLEMHSLPQLWIGTSGSGSPAGPSMKWVPMIRHP
jgi:hypothetical protein